MNAVPARFPQTRLPQIVEMLAGLRPAVIYRFGSSGTPAERPDSDCDLAFLPPAPVDPLQRFAMANRLAGLLGREVDLLDLSACSTVMAKEVLRTGEPLQVADPARRADFEMRTLSDYARLNEERQPVLAALSL